jgi:hypothetical protein
MPYTGNSDGASTGPRAGMDEWIRQAIKYSDGALWNNGSWGVRNMRGSNNLSVHATGRAVDLSYRKSEKHPTANRKATMAFIRVVTANANALGLECILITYLSRTGVAGAVIVNAGVNTRSQPFTVHQAAIGYILR